MKKLLSFVVMMAIMLALQSQVLFQTGFDDKPAGAHVAASYPEWWTTWDMAPGTAEDAVITVEQAQTAPNSVKFSWGNDVVFLAGNPTSGAWTVEFDMLIPGNVPAFFNLLHVFAGSGSKWALGVYFNMPSGSPQQPAGTYVTHNNQNTNFTIPSNTWFPISIFVDLDNDNATISINGEQILEWQFSIGESGGPGQRQLAAVDFYPINNTSVFYIDNFVFAQVGETGTPTLNVTPTTISDWAVEGSNDKKNTVTVANTGTSMGDYNAWVEFAINPTGTSASFDLTYMAPDDQEPSSAFFNDSANPTLEVAHKYTLSKYCEMVGTYITEISYPLNSTTHDDKIVARVYGQGTDNAPGRILAQEVVSPVNHMEGYWIDVTLSTPVLLDGQDIWVAFEFVQNNDQDGLMLSSGGAAPENSDWRRSNGGGWSQLHVVQPSLENGPFMISAYCEGELTPGCWLSLVGAASGSVPAGNSKTFDVDLDATGLEKGTYRANIFVATNDENNPLFEIPCSFKIVDVGIETYTVNDIQTTVYPNPASDKITVESNQNINSIQLINNMGQVVYTATVNAEKTTINTTDISKGIYFLRVNSDAGAKNIKIIVQ